MRAGYFLDTIRQKRPLIHSITNYVTAGDVANMILACGARPVMADHPREAAEVAAACDALNINMGTMKESSLDAMLLAGQEANRLGKPVVLDPVGVGMTVNRRESVRILLGNVRFSVIRGNLSEIMETGRITGVFSSGSDASDGACRGIDTDSKQIVTEENLDLYRELFQKLSADLGCVIVGTGGLDLISDAHRTWVIGHGCPEMAGVIGTGCMLDGLVASFLAAEMDTGVRQDGGAAFADGQEFAVSGGDGPAQAAAAAVLCMDIAGEIGRRRMLPGEGNASYRNRMIDAVSCMEGQELDRYMKAAGKVRCLE